MRDRAAALWQVAWAYLVGLGVAVVAAWLCRDLDVVIQLGVADLAATVAVFGFSVRHDNSSVYDAYWSVIPLWLVSYLAWIGETGVPVRVALVLTLVWFWGLRLTHNWARGWSGFDHEDWRYRNLRAATGRLYWLVSLLGIHLFPTVLVFLGCLPLFPILLEPGQPLSWIDALATVVTGGAVVIELVADNQLRAYTRRPERPHATMTEGIWAWSRHPNYFGEMCFWWGLWLFGVAAVGVGRWSMVAGAVAITLLFNLISVPMIEKRMLARRPDFRAVRARVSRLLPWFPSAGLGG